WTYYDAAKTDAWTNHAVAVFLEDMFGS
ncbi:MAG: hypothetical protein ACI9L9_002752, partial [Marivirga sp.]